MAVTTGSRQHLLQIRYAGLADGYDRAITMLDEHVRLGTRPEHLRAQLVAKRDEAAVQAGPEHESNEEPVGQ